MIWKLALIPTFVRKRVSQTNQDCFFFDRHENSAILLVADGISISSAGSGDIASNITAQTVAHFWTECKETLLSQEPSDIREFLLRTLIHANQEICRIAQEFVEDITSEVPMGTTVLLVLQRQWCLVNLGDSRAYVVMDNGLGLLVGDRTCLVKNLTPHSTRNQRYFKALIRYLGTSMQNGNLHYRCLTFVMFVSWTVRVFWCVLMDWRIMHLILTMDSSNLQYPFFKMKIRHFWKGYQLTALANIRGGGDNITVMLAMPESTKAIHSFSCVATWYTAICFWGDLEWMRICDITT